MKKLENQSYVNPRNLVSQPSSKQPESKKQQPLQLEDTKSENVQKTDNIDKFMKIWLSTHFSTLQEQDKNSPNKVVTWLLS